MSFFDSLIETPVYQAKTLASNQPNMPGQQAGLQALQKGIAPMAPQAPTPPVQMGIAPPMPQQPMPGQQPQGFAKGGLSAANENIEQIQIMKVFKHYFENLGVDVQQGMRNLQKEIDQGLKLIPFESSVMGYKDLGNNVAQIHFFTVGTLKDLTNDMQYFFKYLKNKGVKTVYDTLPAPITTQMLVKLGAKLEKSDNPKYKLKATI